MVIETAGDEALAVLFAAGAREPSPEIHAEVMAALDAVEAARPPWVVDVAPAYTTLLLRYDPLLVTEADARAWLASILPASSSPAPSSAVVARPSRLVEIPVWYDASVAPDLEVLAEAKGMAPAALAAAHAAREYLVYALGFRPGFPFLGTLDAALAAPRLDSPRPRVAAGSVGIAGRQTGIYPVDGPGGWRIVGHTPLHVFDPARGEPFLLRVGDRVRFVPIDGPRHAELARAGRPQL